MTAIVKVRHRPYAKNLAASVRASKMSSDENVINVQAGTLASQTAGAVKEFGVQTLTTSSFDFCLFYAFLTPIRMGCFT